MVQHKRFDLGSRFTDFALLLLVMAVGMREHTDEVCSANRFRKSKMHRTYFSSAMQLRSFRHFTTCNVIKLPYRHQPVLYEFLPFLARWSSLDITSPICTAQVAHKYSRCSGSGMRCKIIPPVYSRQRSNADVTLTGAR